jgi:GT2 family glycosyltransferase
MGLHPATDRLLSVLIVSYNAAEHLTRCFAALDVQTLPPDRFEVIVVENGSTDGTAERIRTQHLRVRLIEAGRNLGFAAGNNLATRHANGSYWVLLNPDTIPDPFWLEEVDRTISENPGAAISSKLLLADDPTRLNSAGLFLLRDGRGADRGFRQPDDGRYEGGGDVFAGCAAALAVPAIRTDEPLFDPSLFLYGEDLELGWRSVLAGRRTVFAPRAVVRHAVGASGGDESPTFWYYTERNRAVLALTRGDPFLAVCLGVGLMLRAVRAVLFAAIGHPAAKYRWPNALAVVRAASAYLTVLAKRTVFRDTGGPPVIPEHRRAAGATKKDARREPN